MKKSLGWIELKSIPMGIKVADEMLKSADIKIILSSPVCPGKYVVIIYGRVGAVKSALRDGNELGGIFVVESDMLSNVHDDVVPAISGICDVKELKSLGVIETISALSSIAAGDIAVKSSNVELVDIRIARGLGGKGFVIITGEISSVKTAINACLNSLKDRGVVTSHVVISSPHKDILNTIYN